MKAIKNKLYTSDLFLACLFLVVPFWALPLSFFQVYKTRRRFYALLISIFFGLTASLLAPTGDLYRAYMTYFQFQETDFNGLLNFLNDKPDFLFYVILYVFAQLGISLRIIIFALIFSFFNLSFNLLLKQKRQVSMIVVLLFILQFDFLLQGLFLRFPLAMLFVIYGYLNKIEGKKGVLLFLLLASLIHFAALITIPLFFLSKIKFKRLNLILLISLFIMPFGSMLFMYLTNNLIHYLPESPLKTKIDIYFLGYWALEFFEERTWKALLLFYLERIFYILVLLYFIFTKDQNKFRRYTLPFLILINILFSFPNLFSRYAVLAFFFGLYTIIQENRTTAISQMIKMSFAIIIPLIFTVRIVAQQKNIRAGHIHSVVYSNFISLSFKTYDLEWIEKHIDRETATPKYIKPL
jgi:hypothetical protein